MNDDLALQLAPTAALIEELTRRCGRIVLLCEFRVSEGQSIEIARWTANEMTALAMAADLQHRILLSIERARPPDRTTTTLSRDAGQDAPQEDDDDPRH